MFECFFASVALVGPLTWGIKNTSLVYKLFVCICTFWTKPCTFLSCYYELTWMFIFVPSKWALFVKGFLTLVACKLSMFIRHRTNSTIGRRIGATRVDTISIRFTHTIGFSFFGGGLCKCGMRTYVNQGQTVYVLSGSNEV